MKTGYKQTPIGEIPEDWKAVSLKDFCKIIMSNVDKKIHPNEEEVYLCNYMDVYKNDYIKKSMQLMKASASLSEIEKFTLFKGDVIITKDSETKEDIAQSTTVIENLDNVLCGYHLALIRPDKNHINNIFLAKLFNFGVVRNQLVNKANGTTRFGLNVETIEGLTIPIPPLPEQEKIAEILSTVDAKIEVIDKQIAQTQELKKGLMQRLLTKGIGHSKFKHSPLGEIPESWEVVKLDSILRIVERPLKMDDNCYYQLVTVKRRFGGVVPRGKLKGIEIKVKNQFFIKGNDFIISKRQIVHGACEVVPMDLNDSIVSNEYTVLNGSKEVEIQWFRFYVQRPDMIKSFLLSSDGVHIEKMLFKLKNWLKNLIALPPLPEQQKIAETLSAVDEKLDVLQEKKKGYGEMKKSLMQQLLTGKLRVNQLVAEPEPA